MSVNQRKTPNKRPQLKGEYMKVNLNQAIKDLQGNDINDVTAKSIVIQSLTMLGEEDKALSGDERYKRYAIALQIAEAEGEVDLKVEDISLVKKLVGNMYQPLVVGRVYDILEGK